MTTEIRTIIFDYIHKHICYHIDDTEIAVQLLYNVYTDIDSMFCDYITDNDRDRIEVEINMYADKYSLDARIIVHNKYSFTVDTVQSYTIYVDMLEDIIIEE